MRFQIFSIVVRLYVLNVVGLVFVMLVLLAEYIQHRLGFYTLHTYVCSYIHVCHVNNVGIVKCILKTGRQSKGLVLGRNDL